ncbi:MAG TPA: HupE/UreJ family protein [Cellvibrio sp.]|nr:HupE/UreJ family protein [Cellvibrio sp.]
MDRIIFFLIFFASFSQAHQLSTAYLQVRINNTGTLEGELQVRLYDLERELALDADANGQLLWGELQVREVELSLYLNHHLQISRAGKACKLALPTPWKIDNHYNEGYLLLPLRAQCALAGDLQIAYSAFFSSDNQHKLLLTVTSDSARDIQANRVLSAHQPRVTIAAADGNCLASLVEFTSEGITHIWHGADHILFLCSLLLGVVLVRRETQWHARQTIRDIIVQSVWIVTAFTLAHSITLTATALDILHLPSRWVEVGIALSVFFAAVNNIFSVVLRLGWLTFCFGLLHGMGFAGALGELGIPADQKILTVLAFNLGVELGQMTIVLALLPFLIWVRNSVQYARYSFMGVSLVIALLALSWVFQRTFI